MNSPVFAGIGTVVGKAELKLFIIAKNIALMNTAIGYENIIIPNIYNICLKLIRFNLNTYFKE
jgi:hypothetical protein